MSARGSPGLEEYTCATLNLRPTMMALRPIVRLI